MFSFKELTDMMSADRTIDNVTSFAKTYLKNKSEEFMSGKTGEIYRIWFVNDPYKRSYVGQTIQGSLNRIKQHVADAERNDGTGCPLLDEATKMYGVDNMRYSVLVSGIEDRESLDEAEKYWIKKLNTIAPNGYNIKSGGQGSGDFDARSEMQKMITEMFGSAAGRAAARKTTSTAGKAMGGLGGFGTDFFNNTGYSIGSKVGSALVNAAIDSVNTYANSRKKNR